MNDPRTIYPERLMQARLLRGLKRVELADLFSVTRQAISQYENGTCKPKDEILCKYQEKLNIPLNFFYKQPINISNSAIHFRRLKNSSKAEREMSTVRICWMAETYQFLNKYVNFSELNIPLKSDTEEYSNAEIEAIAEEVRSLWKIRNVPINNLMVLMENNGCTVSMFDYNGTNIDGCSKIFNLGNTSRPFVAMVSRGSPSACRERFSLAHELGHIVLHSWADSDYVSEKKNYDRMEDEANYFAGAFLLPYDAYSKEAASCSGLTSFIALKSRWNVSIGALARRSKEIGLISQYQYGYINKQLAIKKYKTCEPLDKDIPHEFPRSMSLAVGLLINNNIASAGELLDYLAFPVKEVDQICGFSDEDTPFVQNNIIPFASLKNKASML